MATSESVVNLTGTSASRSASSAQDDVWSLECDVTIEDMDVVIQEIKVDDVILSGSILKEELSVNIGYDQANAMELDVNVVIDGLNSSIVESQVVPFEKVIEIDDFSPEATSEKRFASSARTSKIIYDLALSLGYKVEELFANDETINEVISGLGGKVENLEKKSEMFYWYDDAKTIIATNYPLFSKSTIASGGKASAGSGGSNSENELIPMEEWDEYDSTLPQVLGAKLGIELHDRLTEVENGGADSSYDELVKEIEKKASKEDLNSVVYTVEDHEERIQDLEEGCSNLIPMEKWDDYNPATNQVLGAILGIELNEKLDENNSKLTDVSNAVEDHESRITYLETSGGSSSPELSYDSIIDALEYVPFDEESFTQENIQQTLGIQDWALADNPPANASSADKLSDSKAYTIWGRNFFQNGKPVNVTSSPVFSRNGGFYAYNYKDVSTMLMWYMSDNTHSEFILGHKSSEGLEKTRICGYPICFHIGKYVDSNGIPRTPAMTIDENGDVIIEGNLTVKGTAGVGGKAIESQAVIVGPLALNSSISTGTKTQSQMNVIGFTTDAIANMEDGLYTKVVYNGNVWEYSVKVTSSANKVIFLRNDAGTSYTMTYNGSYWVIS